MSGSDSGLVRVCRYSNAAVLILFSLFFFIVPGVTVVFELADSGVRSPTIPKSAWRLHRSLSPRYERWARTRLASSRAAELSTSNISGTEWPLFGSAFYLWATESLQEAWDKDHSAAAVAPNVYARGAIEAATDLVIDPTQASWVKTHWGDSYLTNENVFYRMLVIGALTSHAKLTGDTRHLPMLKEQADGLAAELDASPYGLLNDYPSECYPGDVLTATAMIRRADKVLGTDHSGFVDREIRGFQDSRLDSLGLVPYDAVAKSGQPGFSRGCGNSYVSLFSPEIWPEQARRWYEVYAEHFWQEAWTCAGFREFAKGTEHSDWYIDVDSGPVLKGFGCAACAFGAGAARVNGHFEHAYPLTAQMLVTSWPLPNGTRLLPRLLSDAADAPLLGEAGILFNLTRLPAEGFPIQKGGSIPGFVFIWLTLQIGFGLLLVAGTNRSMRRWHKERDAKVYLVMRTQFAFWVGLLIAGLVLFFWGKPFIAVICVLAAQLFPRGRRKRSPLNA